MPQVKMKNAPSLDAWLLAAPAGFMAFAVAWRVGALDLMPSAFISALVFLGVGMVLTIAWGGSESPVQAGSASTARGDAGPVTLPAARGGVADDLKVIEGIGPALEKLLNGLGVYHYDQIARWTEADVAWVDDKMTGFKGRISRDNWVEQARIIVKDGPEALRLRTKTSDE